MVAVILVFAAHVTDALWVGGGGASGSCSCPKGVGWVPLARGIVLPYGA